MSTVLDDVRPSLPDPAWSDLHRPELDDQPEESYPARKVVVGSLGRIWLWFLIGCLAITVLPLVIGWSSYLIETGSMRPSIKPGDVVITSPDPELEQLGGRVITFDSPSVPGQVVTHRVVEVSQDGQMRTKGDANSTADSATITIDDVRGMGRLLVRYVGLPKVWLQNGDLLPLAGFILTVVVAGLAVRWDREPDPPESEGDDAETGPGLGAWTTGSGSPSPGSAVPGVSGLRALLDTPVVAAGVPLAVTDQIVTRTSAAAGPAPAGDDAAQPALLRRLRPSSAVVFVLLAGLYGSALAVPSVMAAVSATTQVAASSWSVPQYSYSTTLQTYTPWVYYKLDDTTGNNAVDSSGNGRTGSYSGSFTKNLDGAFETDTPDRGARLNSSNSCLYMGNSAKLTPAPTVYSSTGWFRVDPGYDDGGKLLGFESSRTGVSSSDGGGGQYDRHVYMDGSGRIRFGVWLGYSFTLSSAPGLNDGQWHFVATTMGADGMKLYVDGNLVDSSTNTASETFTNGGWWRFGCGNLSGWTATSGQGEAWQGPNAPTAQQNYPLQGTLDELAIWQNRVLTADEIAFLYFTR